MDSSFYASASRLNEHLALSREEKKIADDLLSRIKQLGRYDAIRTDDRYRQLVKQAGDLALFMKEKVSFIEKFEKLVTDASSKRRNILREVSDSYKKVTFTDF